MNESSLIIYSEMLLMLCSVTA